jgi:predicted RNA-binding protein YlxR (DUF448 family)
VRSCAGCGRRAGQHELLRFGALEGSLVAAPVRGRDVPGRGAYTCKRVACFERATAEKRFARVLRQTVRVDPSLARLYTEESHG